MAIFQLPDGRKVSVPDSVPREVAVKRLREKFATVAPTAPQPTIEQEVSQPVPPESQRSIPQEVGRQLGLTGRAALEGVAALPAQAANVLASGLNEAFGARFPEQSQAFSGFLTDVGFPEPEGVVEETVQDIGQAATAGGALAQGLRKLTPSISPVAEAGTAAATQAGVTGAEQAGFGDVGQLLAGIGTGAGAAKAGNAITALKNRVTSAPILEDIAERGIDDVNAFAQLRSEIGEEGARLQEEIGGRFEGGKKVSPGLFDRAKELGQEAFVNKGAVSQLRDNVIRQAEEEIDADSKKLLENAAERLNNLITKQDVSVNDIEGLRRAASKASQRNFAGGALARDIDEFLGTALENNRITGRTEAIDLWKEAIAKRRDFGNRFETPKEIASAISDDTIETVEKAFLGAGPLATRTELANIYDNALNAVPEAAQEGTGFLLRQSIVNRLIKRAARSVEGEEAISANTLANSIRNLRRENKSIWNKFPDDEKRILNGLEANLRKEAAGGPLNKVAGALFNFLGRATRSNLEVPRIIKPKTAVNIEDLNQLLSVKPTLKEGALTGIAVGIEEPLSNIGEE